LGWGSVATGVGTDGLGGLAGLVGLVGVVDFEGLGDGLAAAGARGDRAAADPATAAVAGTWVAATTPTPSTAITIRLIRAAWVDRPIPPIRKRT
jgi:hypothetical protein